MPVERRSRASVMFLSKRGNPLEQVLYYGLGGRRVQTRRRPTGETFPLAMEPRPQGQAGKIAFGGTSGGRAKGGASPSERGKASMPAYAAWALFLYEVATQPQLPAPALQPKDCR